MSMWLSKFDWSVLSHYASRFFLVLFVLLFGWQLGAMLSFLLQPLGASASSISYDKTSSSASLSVPSLRIPPIYLLGRQATVESSQNRIETVTETDLNLKVLGIVAMPDEQGLVIVQSGNKTLLASVGENIQEGVYLEEVYSDYVVIDHNGALEKLLMSDSNELLDSNAFGVEYDQEVGSGSEFAQLRQTLKKTPMKIMQYVRFQTINAGTRDVELKIWPKKDGELFKAFGLEAGDVLKNVNGQPVSLLMQKPALWKNVLNESVLEMEVSRQGRAEFLVVDLN